MEREAINCLTIESEMLSAGRDPYDFEAEIWEKRKKYNKLLPIKLNTSTKTVHHQEHLSEIEQVKPRYMHYHENRARSQSPSTHIPDYRCRSQSPTIQRVAEPFKQSLNLTLDSDNQEKNKEDVFRALIPKTSVRYRRNMNAFKNQLENIPKSKTPLPQMYQRLVHCFLEKHTKVGDNVVLGKHKNIQHMRDPTL